MNTAVVIPVGAGREENLTLVLKSLMAMSFTPAMVVLVADGEAAFIEEDEPIFDDLSFKLAMTRYRVKPVIVNTAKHHPGMEQPRNLGVRAAEKVAAEEGIDLTHVWFLDSDCIVSRGALAAYELANLAAGPELADKRILVGPYDWLARDWRELPPCTAEQGALTAGNYFEMADPRWISFREHTPEETLRGDLSAGLACFSGNLVWPIEDFKHVGGFWNELHHGRCEDGELGLRAVAVGTPIGFVRDATAFHLWHTRNPGWAMRANARDVPMLNERHAWMEGRCSCGHQREDHELVEGLPDPDERGTCQACDECSGFQKAIFVVDEDGKRFNASCPCGWSGNTMDIWAHQGADCPLRRI